jgi:ATP-dependent DNA helicase RecG
MIEDMLREGHPSPHFESRPFLFSVSLSNARERVDSKWIGILNERQLRGLSYLQENGSITNSEFRDLCPEVGAETLRLDLVEMVDQGILLRVGAKRGTRYILK